MSDFDWKSKLSEIVAETAESITSSTNTSITFSLKDTAYCIDFSAQVVTLTKVSDNSVVFRFPRVPPIGLLVLRAKLKGMSQN